VVIGTRIGHKVSLLCIYLWFFIFSLNKYSSDLIVLLYQFCLLILATVEAFVISWYRLFCFLLIKECGLCCQPYFHLTLIFNIMVAKILH